MGAGMLCRPGLGHNLCGGTRHAKGMGMQLWAMGTKAETGAHLGGGAKTVDLTALMRSSKRKLAQGPSARDKPPIHALVFPCHPDSAAAP